MLRQVIRKLILEIYELSPADRKHLEEMEPGERGSGDVRRALGLQNKSEIQADREVLQIYQDTLRQMPDGEEMIKEFTSGGISVCHSPFYAGYAVSRGSKQEPDSLVGEQTLLRDWLRKYGKNSKDTLSCVAFNRNVGDAPIKVGVNPDAFTAVGFYMKGYPVYVNEQDVMSQTLGALPPGLVDHQKNSGIAKRAGWNTEGTEIYGLEWHWAGEVLLDNWTPIGVYVNIGTEEIDYEESAIRDILHDALETGLPVWGFAGLTKLGKVTDEDAFIERNREYIV